VHDALRSPGRPLESSVREEMEARFGHDFSSVRVHTDGGAAESARAVNANAYTVGSDVVFGPGRYAPATYEGSRLLAHELAHTVQQRGATTEAAPVAPGSPLEDAAAFAGRAVASGRAVSQPLGTSGLALAREVRGNESEWVPQALQDKDKITEFWSAWVRFQQKDIQPWEYVQREADKKRIEALAAEAATLIDERKKAVEEAEAVAASMGMDEEEEAQEAALLKIAERAPDPRFQPGGFTDEDIYGEYEATKKRLDEELAPAKDPRPFKVRFKEAQHEALNRPILPYDQGGSHESIWRYGLSKGLFAERERKLVADELLAPYAEKAEQSRRQWEIQRYNAQLNRFRNFRAQLNLGFIQGALLGRPGVPPIIRGGYFSYGVAHTTVEAYRGYQAGDPSRVVGAVLPLVAGYGFHRIAGMGEPPPGMGGLPPLGRVLNPQRGKPVEIFADEVLATYQRGPEFVKKLGSDPWAQVIWETQGGDGIHPMAWKHPNGRVVYVNEGRWTGKLSEINQPHELVAPPPVPAPTPTVAPPVVPIRPGTVTVELSLQNGLVKPAAAGGKLEPVLRAIQDEYAAGPPTNLNEGLALVTRATIRAKVGRGERSQPSATEYQLKNVGGVITRILASGEIIVINRAGQVVLHLLP
jgi:hypothetical protein